MSFKIDQTKKSYAPRPLPKSGTQAARLISVVGLGRQERPPYQGQEKAPADMIWINFELVNDKYERDGEKVNHRISPRNMVISTDPKAALAKLVNSLDPENNFKWDLEKLLNLPCLVSVAHAKVTKAGPDGKPQENTYANFVSALPAPEGLPVPEASVPPLVFNFDDPTEEGYKSLPKFIRDRLKSAVNFKGSKVEQLANKFDAELDAGAAETSTNSAAY